MPGRVANDTCAVPVQPHMCCVIASLVTLSFAEDLFVDRWTETCLLASSSRSTALVSLFSIGACQSPSHLNHQGAAGNQPWVLGQTPCLWSHQAFQLLVTPAAEPVVQACCEQIQPQTLENVLSAFTVPPDILSRLLCSAQVGYTACSKVVTAIQHHTVELL